MKYLKKLDKMSNVTVFVLLLDAYDMIKPYFKRRVNLVKPDNVFTFQKSDSVRFGFNYTNTIYSKIDLTYIEKSNNSDIYFIGADKNRIETIYEIYKKLSQKGLICDFTVVVSILPYHILIPSTPSMMMTFP